MKSYIALGILGACSMGLFAVGCATSAETEEVVDQAGEALSATDAKPPLAVDLGAPKSSKLAGALASVTVSDSSTLTLFKKIDLHYNCKLEAWTTGATASRDPVMGIIINNGNPLAYGSASEPCHHSAFYNQEGYTTLSWSDNYSGYNANVTWTDPDGGDATVRSVFVVGFLNGSNSTGTTQSPGTLTTKYKITNCNQPQYNVDETPLDGNFYSIGKKGSLPGNVTTSLGTASDPVLYELDTAGSRTSQSGNAKCNDDCNTSTRQSCITGNSGQNMFYFTQSFYSSGTTVVQN